eukprot:RCo020426
MAEPPCLGNCDAGQEHQSTVAEVVAQALVDAGVTHVFGGHGSFIVPLVNAIIRNPKLKWVLMRNEGSASLAACAMAKLTGQLACCLSTSGPGATNLTTGLVDAATDRVSVLALTGLRPRWDIGYSEFQDIDQTALFHAAGVEFAHTVVHSRTAVPLLRNAIHYALNYHTVAALAIPADIQASTIRAPPPVLPTLGKDLVSLFAPPPRPTRLPPTEELEAAADLLRGPAKRVVVGVGPSAATFPGAGEAITALAESLNAPIVTTLDAKGVISEAHPLNFGVMGIFGNPGLEAARMVCSSGDILLLFGMSLAAEFVVGEDKLQSRVVILVHPDKGYAINTSWMRAHFQLVGCLTDVAKELNARLSPRDTTGKFMDPDNTKKPQSLDEHQKHEPGEWSPQWDYIKSGGWKKVSRKLSQQCWEPDQPWKQLTRPGYCHPGTVLAALGSLLGPDDVVTVDAGNITLWTSLCLKLEHGTRVLSSQFMATMGYGLPAGIVAALLRPKARAVVICGDGGVQMTLGELAAAQQWKLGNLVMIIFNNGILSQVDYGFEDTLGNDITSPDFVKLVEAYGGAGVRVDDPKNVAGALELALKGREGPFVVEVRVDPSLKAHMATAKSCEDPRYEVIARPLAAKMWPGDLQRLQEAFGRESIDVSMLSHEEFTVATALFQALARDRELSEALLEALHRGEYLPLQTVKPLLPPHAAANIDVTRLREGGGTTLHDIGCVHNMLSGDAPRELLLNPVHTAGYRAGFEVGTVGRGEASELSEMILVNGTAFLAEVNSPGHCKLGQGSVLFSTAAVLLPASAQPNFAVHFRGCPEVKAVQWNRLINDIHTKVGPQPFFFTGMVHFTEVSGQTLAVAPAHHEPLLLHVHKYYPASAAVGGRDRYAFVCGLSAQCVPGICPEILDGLQRHLFDIAQLEQHSRGPEPETPAQRLQSFLRSCPRQFTSPPVMTHTHALLLHTDSMPSRSSEVTAKMAERVVHLRGDSLCDMVSVEVFTINAIEPVPAQQNIQK